MIHVDCNGLIIRFVDSEYLVYIPYDHISTKDFRRYVWIGFTYGNIRWVVATIQLLICWFCLSRIFFTAHWIPSKPAKFHVHHNVIHQVIMKSSIQTYIFQLQSNLNAEHSHGRFLKCVIDHNKKTYKTGEYMPLSQGGSSPLILLFIMEITSPRPK